MRYTETPADPDVYGTPTVYRCECGQGPVIPRIHDKWHARNAEHDEVTRG